MDFEQRSIKTSSPLIRAEHWVRGHIYLSIILIAVGAFLLKGVIGASAAGSPFSVKQIVLSAVSEPIERDEEGHTNILLLGVGGEGHDGENLTDTIIVASIDPKNNLVPMISIPRDLYVKSEALGWSTRINSIYEFMLDETEDPVASMDALIAEVEEVMGLDIHYYAKVDFNGFVEVVDAMGGVTLNVEEDIYDPYYPAPPGSINDYQTFSLKAGEQKLDGDTALKFVRSRKTSSDFDRARRQQELLAALKDKATSLGILLNPVRLKNIYESAASHIETNLEWTEMLYLAKLADEFGSEAVLTEVIHDDPSQAGGFLYTPERQYYEGAYVLIPYAGDFSEIQLFAKFFLYHTELFQNQTPLHVLNGTKEPGFAAMTKMYLQRYGFNIVRYGNGLDLGLQETRLFYNQTLSDLDQESMELLSTDWISGRIEEETPLEYSLEQFPSEAKIIIELGADFLDFYNEHSELFYTLYVAPAPAAESETEEGATETSTEPSTEAPTETPSE